jgi:acyl-CoA synthetase (AMP-forming)/AMP-acid ligase II
MAHLIDFFERGLRISASAPCFAEPGGRVLDYGTVADLSHRIANGLHAAGVGPGDKVGLLSPNHLLTFVAVLGIVRSRGIWLPVNARNSIEENLHVLARGHCAFLFLHSSFAGDLDKIRAALPDLKGLVIIDGPQGAAPGLEQWAAAQSAAPVASEGGGDDIVAIRGTGGTTGMPKGVLVTHRMYATLLANWFAAMPVRETPVHLVVAPLTHAAGMVAFATLAYGGVNIVLPSPRPEAILQAMERHRVTQLFCPPTVIYRLLAHPEVRRWRYDALRYFVYSAAPMSAAKLKLALEVFGPVMVQCYGQAEAPFTCTTMTTEDHVAAQRQDTVHRLASCGRAGPFVRVEIMDPQGGLLGPGERGEIVVQGDLVMAGYYNNPEGTAQALRGGWLHTGDVGYRDADGFFYIVDRMKDLIISGGFNISPGEIEQVLWAHPLVNDCAVIGVPDEDWGEAVKAIIELKPGARWNAEDAIAYCRARLDGMKTPKSVEFRDELPRSQVGKVLKQQLREPYWAGRDRRV